MTQHTTAELARAEQALNHLMARPSIVRMAEILKSAAPAKPEPAVVGDLRQAARALIAAFSDPTCSLASLQNYVTDLYHAVPVAAPVAQPLAPSGTVTAAMVDACYDHPEKVPEAGKRLMAETLRRALAAQPLAGQDVRAVTKMTEFQRYNEWAFRKEGDPIGLMHGNDAGREAWMARAVLAAPSPVNPKQEQKP